MLVICMYVYSPEAGADNPLGSYYFHHQYFFNQYKAAFTYYCDPAILRNKLTPLSIFKDLALRK